MLGMSVSLSSERRQLNTPTSSVINKQHGAEETEVFQSLAVLQLTGSAFILTSMSGARRLVRSFGPRSSVLASFFTFTFHIMLQITPAAAEDLAKVDM